MPMDLTGITNENEFYTHHYLSVILENDLKNLFASWRQRETEQGLQPPYVKLERLARPYFILRGRMEGARTMEDLLELQHQFFPSLII